MTTHSPTDCPGAFWDALAPHHWRIENSYLELSIVRNILGEIHEPVLVVGAGQGLIVAELQNRGLKCVGIDLSAEMIRYARSRRGLRLIRADAAALPFAGATFRTVIFATGVIDFIADECSIARLLQEARRVATSAGVLLVAFYRMSAASEAYLTRLGLLKDGALHYREILESYRMRPVQALAWIGARAGVGKPLAALLAIRCLAMATLQEKRNVFALQRVFADHKAAAALIESAGTEQPYRDAPAIHGLFGRLNYPIDRIIAFPNCHVVKLNQSISPASPV